MDHKIKNMVHILTKRRQDGMDNIDETKEMALISTAIVYLTGHGKTLDICLKNKNIYHRLYNQFAMEIKGYRRIN